MKLIFAGTPEFARVALERLHAQGHEIALVLTQPDRPAGRGMKLQASAVKQFALSIGVLVAQPRSLRLDGKFADDARAAQQQILGLDAQAMVVAAYGLILPQWVLDAMAPVPEQGPGRRFGCLNIHGSLLPRWRGAAPIHRAIEAGDAHTGVTIMQMDAGLDTGDMLMSQAIAIADDDTTASLHDKVADLGARLMVQVLEDAQAGRLQRVAQPEVGVTYAHKIEKHESAIDWTLDAQAIDRRVRAFNPFPGASFVWQNEVIKVWRSQVLPAGEPAPPGTVLAVSPQGVDVATRSGVLRLLELQRAGARRLNVADFVHGFALPVGVQLESA